MIGVSRGTTRVLAWVFACVATVLCISCSDGEQMQARDALGNVSMSLRDATGVYELSGSLMLDRQGSPPHSQTELLGGQQQRKDFSLPVGDYSAHLVSGWRLVRNSAGVVTDVTHLVTSVTITPDPITVSAGVVSVATVSFTLSDGGSVALDSGQVDVVLAADDQGLVCGGCAPGQVCLQQNEVYRCADTCIPSEAADPCGLGRQCKLLYVQRGDSTLTPQNVCVNVAVEVVDQSAAGLGNLSAAINEGFRFVAQSYTAGVNGTLIGVAVEVVGFSDRSLRVAVRRAPDGVPEATAAAEVVLQSGSSALEQVVTLPVPVQQAVGERFAIVVDYPTAPPQGAGMQEGCWVGTPGADVGDLYPAGALLFSTDGTTWLSEPIDTLHFRTIVKTLP